MAKVLLLVHLPLLLASCFAVFAQLDTVSIVALPPHYDSVAPALAPKPPQHPYSHPPAHSPVHSPAYAPAHSPSHAPVHSPSHAPTHAPIHSPSHTPTHAPVHSPSHAPAHAPVHSPSHAPAHAPVHSPSHAPAHAPVHSPSHAPTHAPVHSPSHAPTHAPVHSPSNAPFYTPSHAPVHSPPHAPARAPPNAPYIAPTHPPSHHFRRALVAVQGVVYCKSCKYTGADTLMGATPILGAVVKLQCNHTKHPFTVQANTEKNGYFYLQAPEKISKHAANKCKAFLVSSPLATCQKPSTLHGGVTGAVLREEKSFVENKLPHVLYTVGPLAFEPKCPH